MIKFQVLDDKHVILHYFPPAILIFLWLKTLCRVALLHVTMKQFAVKNQFAMMPNLVEVLGAMLTKEIKADWLDN